MILIFRLKVIYIIWIYQSPTLNIKYPGMVYAYLMNLFNSISDELLISIQSCTILICMYAIILLILAKTKNKLNKQR